MNKLKHIEGKVIIKINEDYKNWHTFSDGTRIRRERQWNELNRRVSEPVNAIVMSAENIPEGAEILIHPNEIHESNRIHNYNPLSGEDVASDWKYYSISSDQCFAWTIEGNWMPIPPYEFALRVFKPYTGILQGIDPEPLKRILYITTGEYSGNVCHTIVASDYEIIYQERTGREGRLIRCRPNGDGKHGREEEIIAIDHTLTDKVKTGELLVGYDIGSAKKIDEYGRNSTIEK